MEPHLLPPEPVATKDEKREVECLNDDCPMFGEYVEETVEVTYWGDDRAEYYFQCEACMNETWTEFNPTEEIDWEAYYDDQRI